MLLGGILLAWMIFFGAGQAFNLFAARMEQSGVEQNSGVAF
jgi:hypothetical protein